MLHNSIVLSGDLQRFRQTSVRTFPGPISLFHRHHCFCAEFGPERNINGGAYWLFIVETLVSRNFSVEQCGRSFISFMFQPSHKLLSYQLYRDINSPMSLVYLIDEVFKRKGSALFWSDLIGCRLWSVVLLWCCVACCSGFLFICISSCMGVVRTQQYFCRSRITCNAHFHFISIKMVGLERP